MTCGSKGYIDFFVRGLPITQGSKTAYVIKGRPVVTAAAKGLGAWRRLVADQGQAHAPPMPWDEAVVLQLTFYLPRPKSAPKRRRTWPIGRPDLSKATRAVEDALTHIFWVNDSRIIREVLEKRYADDPFEEVAKRRPPGVLIETWPLENGGSS